ncbi:hypothetical protein LX97_02446 [Nonlabens dokdonensis]|jgi:uncharacterized protein YijF (DUF1287 family)|uniref:DUF1287 domain containing protein n=2 Tax=Nonlabens dokdonensis TaxID=328515 RepID=L7W5U8_NONDD|nr:DUF1287 domain-containing protein [Nonlabens dokdonensis]AGC75176.1 DUF1287 domain containing protein [Nonlabens dokdonensis DSW-6]PZX39080.1 hypothetical protein LX97_02446 [Nonlabens dokdonensis]
MHFKKIILSLFLITSLSVVGQTGYGIKVATAAEELTKDKVVYNGTYFKIPYPNGDVPKPYGVCTDLVIRTYRKLGIDLQKEVHEDMKAHFSEYPKNWGLKKTDTNIDHRRVPNLRTFFSRNGESLTVSQNAVEYLPGDIVSWKLGNGLTHIGMVSKTKSKDKKRYLMVHNIGAGQVFEDCLFSFKITGHYRYGK